MRGKEDLLRIRNNGGTFLSGTARLHAHEVVSTATCYLRWQRRREGGRLDKVKQSGLLKFKVFKWPIINSSDGAEAVISENNSKIISPQQSPPQPRPPPPRGACRHARGRTVRLKTRYKTGAKFDVPGKSQRLMVWEEGNHLEEKIMGILQRRDVTG